VILFLVRHAKGYSRARWFEDDDLRPLTPIGDLQSEAIATAIAEEQPRSLLSSPAVRCYQTLQPLARQTGLRIELDPRLAEGADPAGVLPLLDGLGEETVVLCSHGDVVPALLSALKPQGLGDGPIECRKGSFWRLERERNGQLRATYWLPRAASGKPGRSVGGPSTRRMAVFDLGSSSFHLLVADAEPGGTLHRVGRERVMLRLGSMITDGSLIPRDACLRAVETVTQMRQDAQEAGAQELLPVATAALREARNGPVVVEKLSRALGTPVRVISGQQEARLIFRALHRRLEPGAQPTLGLDLGGGSLELALGRAGEVEWEETLPLGTVRLHQELAPGDPLGDAQAQAIAERVRRELAPCLEPVRRHAASLSVAIGGTVRALYRLAHELEEEAHRIPRGASLTLDQVAGLDERLRGSTHVERVRMRGMSPRRADLLPAGALIVRHILQELALHEIQVCDWGLREGVILEAIQRPAETTSDPGPR
jgi:exopolyphosphatase/guanosine-5'-triphosphate,3'-diphosphate pyrophosphatase